MPELQLFGMQVHAVGCLAVEGVAQDGAIHAFRMGRVETELVGASGSGVVGYPGAEMLLPVDEDHGVVEDFVSGDGIFPVFGIDPLEGAVVVVGTEGQTDEAVVAELGGDTVEQGNVAFLDDAVLELFLQIIVGVHVLGDKEQA